MENIATRAPWLSSLSLIAAKIRPIWISPAVKLHLENWGKDHDEKSRTSGISPDQSAWQTWPAPDTGRSLGFPAHWAALLHHEDWLLSKIIFHLQGCLRQLRVWFPYFKELLPKCSHDISPDSCSCTMYAATIALWYRMSVSSPDFSWTPWVTMGDDAWLQLFPRFSRPVPQKLLFFSRHLGSASCSLECFDTQYLGGVLVCVHICQKQLHAFIVEGKTSPPHCLSLHYLHFWAMTYKYCSAQDPCLFSIHLRQDGLSLSVFTHQNQIKTQLIHDSWGHTMS